MSYTASRLGTRFFDTERLDRDVLAKIGVRPEDLTPRTVADIWRKCADDEDFFVFNFVRTKDQSVDDRVSIRPFPSHEYLVDFFYTMRTTAANAPILVPKSRRCVITWSCCAHAVWLAKFRKNRLCLMQGQKEKKAQELVFYKRWDNGRCSFIESHLPPWLRSEACEAVAGNLFYPTGSKIQAISMGEHAARGEGASFFMLDECAFWPEFVESYKVALAMASDGCRVVAVSSACAGSPMAALVGEEEDDEYVEEEEEEAVL